MTASETGQAVGEQPTMAVGSNRFPPLCFVLAFAVVSILADIVYEGGRAIIGPYLASFEASAVFVGVVTGLGEAVACVLRLAIGPLADRTRRYWPISIEGHLITLVSVPVLAAVARRSLTRAEQLSRVLHLGGHAVSEVDPGASQRGTCGGARSLAPVLPMIQAAESWIVRSLDDPGSRIQRLLPRCHGSSCASRAL